ncbi:6-phospho-3-hexuloisomerase [Fictibacillus sp. Mic-4]|uniref:6-phospho-3-hexuloisomerase n=1 Tax=Fictibacillus sp. Mic-4 TaxID=3132826 RepID=UPI003CECDCF2
MNKIETILHEIESVLGKMDEAKWREAAEILLGGRRVFVVGEGRSGLMAKSFAMRLMHLGAESYVVGETITPAIGEGDLLVAISGSGTTKQVIWTAEKAKEKHAKVIGITTNPESPLASLASFLLHVPAATKYRLEAEVKSIQPLGSLFDQCAHLLFDSICLYYAEKKEIDNEKAFSKHSNLE